MERMFAGKFSVPPRILFPALPGTQDDIILILQIVPDEIVPDQKYSHVNLGWKTSCLASHKQHLKIAELL